MELLYHRRWLRPVRSQVMKACRGLPGDRWRDCTYPTRRKAGYPALPEVAIRPMVAEPATAIGIEWKEAATI
jgi:hypothetical protein